MVESLLGRLESGEIVVESSSLIWACMGLPVCPSLPRFAAFCNPWHGANLVFSSVIEVWGFLLAFPKPKVACSSHAGRIAFWACAKIIKQLDLHSYLEVGKGFYPASLWAFYHTSQRHGNFKSLLQQHVQQNLNTTPAYHVLDEKGPDHNKCFESEVNIKGQHFPSAWGTNKKEAEQKAAFNALVELGILKKDSYEQHE